MNYMELSPYHPFYEPDCSDTEDLASTASAPISLKGFDALNLIAAIDET